MKNQVSDPTLESIRNEIDELNIPSTRARVLLAAAVIDQTLERLLRRYFEVRSNASDSDIDILLINQPLPPLGRP